MGGVGIDSVDLRLEDGSGLSAYNLVTARALTLTLVHVARGPFAEVLRSALAEPGEEDSTLEERLLPLRGRLFAKTGTIANVNALSGYLTGSDGTPMVFSILSNGSGLRSGRIGSVIDRFLLLIAQAGS